MKEFKSALALLGKAKIADRNQGGLVVLGFGLLLWECWRAIEQKPGDESSPTFLQDSFLDKKKID